VISLRLVIDTNILISALLRDSTTRRILMTAPIDFVAPPHVFQELTEHIIEVKKRSRLPFEQLHELLRLLQDHIGPVEVDKESDALGEAGNIIGTVDPEDVPIIAAALSIKCDGIWSEDLHLQKQDQIKIWKTKDLLHFIEKS
jgi:putative PIN family toxin of toxin-antitoxin system